MKNTETNIQIPNRAFSNWLDGIEQIQIFLGTNIVNL